MFSSKLVFSNIYNIQCIFLLMFACEICGVQSPTFSISIEWNVQTNITNWICMNLWKIIVTSYLFVKKNSRKSFWHIFSRLCPITRQCCVNRLSYLPRGFQFVCNYRTDDIQNWAFYAYIYIKISIQCLITIVEFKIAVLYWFWSIDFPINKILPDSDGE